MNMKLTNVPVALKGLSSDQNLLFINDEHLAGTCSEQNNKEG